MTIENDKKVVYDIIRNYDSKYIRYHTLLLKTGLKKGQVSLALSRLNKEGRIKRRSQSTWERV
jgi:predicted transcriptional regulator